MRPPASDEPFAPSPSKLASAPDLRSADVYSACDRSTGAERERPLYAEFASAGTRAPATEFASAGMLSAHAGVDGMCQADGPRITVTDVESVMPLLRETIRANGVAGGVKAATLFWGRTDVIEFGAHGRCRFHRCARRAGDDAGKLVRA